MVMVMDPNSGAQKVSTEGRPSESHRKDSDMVMALCGLPWRPMPDKPALDEVPVRVSAESKVPWQDLPDAPKPRAQRSRADVCKSTTARNHGSMSTLKVAPVYSSRDRIEGVGPQRCLSIAYRRIEKRMAERG